MLVTEGEATAATIRAAGGDAVFVKTDVSREADCKRLAAAAVERHGKLDVLICCAGDPRGATLQAEALDEATFESVLDVNLKGTFLTVKSALPHLRTATQPAVLLLASEAGTKIPSSSLAYGASKGGVHGFAMTLEAQQLRPARDPRERDLPSSIATPMRIDNLVDRARAAGRDPEQAGRRRSGRRATPWASRAYWRSWHPPTPTTCGEKRLLGIGKPALGSFCLGGSPLIAETLGRAGYDFVIVDLQHGESHPGNLLGMLQAVSCTPATPLVRVAANQPVDIQRALDLGAYGPRDPYGQQPRGGRGHPAIRPLCPQREPELGSDPRVALRRPGLLCERPGGVTDRSDAGDRGGGSERQGDPRAFPGSTRASSVPTI